MKKTISLVVAMMFLAASVSQAWSGRDYHREYRGGPGLVGAAIVGGLTAGVIIANLPSRHDVVYVNGAQYYYDGQYYYQQGPQGYVVVQPVVQQPRVVERFPLGTRSTVKPYILWSIEDGHQGDAGIDYNYDYDGENWWLYKDNGWEVVDPILLAKDPQYVLELERGAIATVNAGYKCSYCN